RLLHRVAAEIGVHQPVARGINALLDGLNWDLAPRERHLELPQTGLARWQVERRRRRGRHEGESDESKMTKHAHSSSTESQHSMGGRAGHQRPVKTSDENQVVTLGV